MRISDWSSDVCSSDLAPGIAWLDPESGLDNFKRLLARKRPIPLTIHYLDPLQDAVEFDSTALAEAARPVIAGRMDTTTRTSAGARYGPSSADAIRLSGHVLPASKGGVSGQSVLVRVSRVGWDIFLLQ